LRALVKYEDGYGKLRLEEIKEPMPGECEVRIKVEYAGICGTDLHIYNGAGYNFAPPVVLGHELSGVVDLIGRNASRELAGKRVASETYYFTCGSCHYCRTGRYNLCLGRKSIGSLANGAFAEYVVVPEKNIHILPDDVGLKEAVITEPLACCCQAVFESTHLVPGDRVLITGPGPIGLLCLQLVKSAGCLCAVVGTRKDEERLLIAESLGADQIFYADDTQILDDMLAFCNGLGFAHTFECSGHEAAVHLCLQAIKKGGTHVQIGLTENNIRFDLNTVILKEITIHGSFAQKWVWWEKALALLSLGAIRTDVLIDCYPLDKWEEAFTNSLQGKGIKHILTDLGNC